MEIKIKDFVEQKLMIEAFKKRTYVPVEEKFAIAEVVFACVTEDNNGFIVEVPLYREVIPFLFIIEAYTNIDCSLAENAIDTYNMIMSDDMCRLKNIYSVFPDAQELKNIIEKFIDKKIALENSINKQISTLFAKLGDAMPTEQETESLLAKTKETFDGISTKKLNGILGVINKITPQKDDNIV